MARDASERITSDLFLSSIWQAVSVQLRGRVFRLVVAGLLALTPVLGEDLKALYLAHRWDDLAAAVRADRKTPLLYRAIVASVFNDNEHAERMLRSVLRSSPRPDVLPIAYEALVHIYLRTGRYRSLMETVREARAAVPTLDWPKEAFAAFEGLPDQITVRAHQATLTHEAGEIFIPAAVNSESVTYFFDTGAWLNSISESEARRLQLRFADQSTGSSVTTSTGGQAAMRMAVASSVTIGGIHYRDVSFAVFPDEQEPWSLLPVGRRGLLGISLIQGFRTMRWNPSGGMEIGFGSKRVRSSLRNLYFDDDHLTVASKTNGQRVCTTVDTGAITTDLYQNFARQFAGLLNQKGTKEKHEIRGMGGAATSDAMALPRLSFELGGANVILSPAHITLQQIGDPRCVGNFGMDLFKQGRYLLIDLQSMRLELGTPSGPN
jgi:predicted aspartyl protease